MLVGVGLGGSAAEVATKKTAIGELGWGSGIVATAVIAPSSAGIGTFDFAAIDSAAGVLVVERHSDRSIIDPAIAAIADPVQIRLTAAVATRYSTMAMLDK